MEDVSWSHDIEDDYFGDVDSGQDSNITRYYINFKDEGTNKELEQLASAQ